MKGKFGKIGIISLALVLALGTVGAAFAHWTETLTTEANVSTGELKLELTNIRPSDELGDISCTKTSWGDDFQTFTLTVEHAYPGYAGTVMFDITNTGSIPARICCGISEVFPPSWAKVHPDDTLVFGVQPMMPGESYQDKYIEVEIPAPGDGCPENDSFSFTLTIKAVQWNAPCP